MEEDPAPATKEPLDSGDAGVGCQASAGSKRPRGEDHSGDGGDGSSSGAAERRSKVRGSDTGGSAVAQGGDANAQASPHSEVQDAFSDLRLTPIAQPAKEPCPSCNKKAYMYCAWCHLSMLKDVPKVSLALPLQIIHHKGEKFSKSTAVHALCVSDDAEIHEFPNVPTYDPKHTVLLFPSPDAKAVSELDLSHVKQLVVIDSTWQKTRAMIADARLACLPTVIIKSYTTRFWRYQPDAIGDGGLATIEAIYYFYKELWCARHPGQAYDGSYDNLMLFFVHIYRRVQHRYKAAGEDFPRIANFLEKD